MSAYLDNAATTKPCENCIDAMNRAMMENYGNPSSLHGMGLKAQLAMDAARKELAGALGAQADEILFTSGATESNNMAILGTAALYGKRKRRIVTTTVEHACVKGACDALEAQGYEVIRIAPNADGNIDSAEFAAAVDENTCLVSMMLVNNETGHILPVKETFSMIKKRFPLVICHTDAVQGFLKVPFRVTDLQADLLTVSGHKVHAAKGIGALYHKKGVRLSPLLHGGEQEGGNRPGTESVPLIVGFGAAVKEMRNSMDIRRKHCTELRNLCIEKLQEIDGISIQSPSNGSPFILSISAEGLRSETLLHFLEEREIYVSSGSACSKGKQSGVLQQFGVPDRLADSTIRISFCAENTVEDVLLLAEQIAVAQHTLIHKR